MNKQELRKYAMHTRKSLDIRSISQSICLKLIDFFAKQNVKDKKILVYMPFRSEIDLTMLFSEVKTHWFLPRVNDDKQTMSILSYCEVDDLHTNSWGILEPHKGADKIEPEELDIVIMPALMADKHGYRLGYGAGFYDRLVVELREDCIKIVPVAEILFVPELAHDVWDKPADLIVTEKKFLM